MPLIDKGSLLRDAVNSVRQIHRIATGLRNQSGSISFEVIWTQIEAMDSAHERGIAPLLALGGATAVNATYAEFFSGGPANFHAAVTDVQAKLGAFATEYETIFATLTPITYTVADGHGYADIPGATFASLVTPLDNLIASCDAVLG